MNSKFIAQSNNNGLYFVKGSGFVTNCKAAATVLDVDGIACLRQTLGFNVTAIPADTSFAVCYVRKGDLNGDGTVKANALNPSRRRFATRQEANQHGSRFPSRKAKGSRVEGSAGHIGFYVIETNDPVNATINWATGLTNSI